VSQAHIPGIWFVTRHGEEVAVVTAEYQRLDGAEGFKEFLTSAPDSVLEIDRPATTAQIVDPDPDA